MEFSDLQRMVTLSNPWWRDPDWASRDAQLRDAETAPYVYEPRVLDDLVPGGLYLLRGPRRVGKSTEMKRTVAHLLAERVEPRSIVFLSVEGLAWADLEHAISYATSLVHAEPGQGFWFIDEVTGVDGPWSAAVKRMRDLNFQFARDTVVLSGSSAAGLEEATKNLAGRRGRATNSDRVLLQMPFVEFARAVGAKPPALPPMSPAELASGALAEAVDAIQPWLPALHDAWELYLRVGGYPQAVAEHLRTGTVDPSTVDAVFGVVHGDALARHDVMPTQTEMLLRSLSRSLSSTLAVNAVANDVSIAEGTARALLEGLRRSFLAFPVHREQGLAPKPRSMAKWYFTDPLLARLASVVGAGQPPESGAIAEQQLGVALLRALERIEPRSVVRHGHLLYYRSSTGAEIDFVSPRFDGACFESKYVDRNWGRAFQTISASPYKFGVVATRSGSEERPNGWALPVSLLVTLLGG